MLIIFSEHKMITFFLLLFFLISILCQIISGVIYQNMIKQSENMSETENKLLKLCKQKYAGYYKLNGRILNTSVFVDKFLQKTRLWGISLYRFPHISGQFMMLSVLMAGIASCLILAAGGSLFQIIPYYLLCILGLYLYFSVSGIIDLQEKKKILKVNLMDYLENHYAPRLEIERENALLNGVKKREVYAKELEETEPKKKEGIHHAFEKSEKEVQKESAELENLLEEFFA